MPNDKITDLQIKMVDNLWQYLLTDYWKALLILVIIIIGFLAWRQKRSLVEVIFNGYVDDLIKYYTNKHKIESQNEIKTLEIASKNRRQEDNFSNRINQREKDNEN